MSVFSHVFGDVTAVDVTGIRKRPSRNNPTFSRPARDLVPAPGEVETPPSKVHRSKPRPRPLAIMFRRNKTRIREEGESTAYGRGFMYSVPNVQTTSVTLSHRASAVVCTVLFRCALGLSPFARLRSASPLLLWDADGTSNTPEVTQWKAGLDGPQCNMRRRPR